MAFNIDTIINNALMQLPDTYEINITHLVQDSRNFVGAFKLQTKTI